MTSKGLLYNASALQRREWSNISLFKYEQSIQFKLIEMEENNYPTTVFFIYKMIWTELVLKVKLKITTEY